MIEDDDLLSAGADGVGGPAEHARMDDRILAAYRREFGPRRRVRRALRALPVALALGGLLAWGVLRERPAEQKAPAAAAPPAVRLDASLVTQTSLAGFKPVDDVEVNVLGGGLP
jgi:hypothetical protein